MERDDFARLVAGTHLSLETLLSKVLSRDWYLFAQEALQHKLVAGLV